MAGDDEGFGQRQGEAVAAEQVPAIGADNVVCFRFANVEEGAVEDEPGWIGAGALQRLVD